ncbi:unnamed protein product [Symbiodinium pilosum]|uniref:Uncharacterized protein n=1 Tax=Symbiodinium pilosum TaxID=2952 RepID=A0A812XVL8_SYMPI|nr:unnamed protein product [Symbiodinium pilosum]
MFEVGMAKKAVAVAKLGRRSDAVAAKLRYELARMKQAHLARLLLLWHSGRLFDIKNLVLDWDVSKEKTAHGMQWVMDRVEFKTKWRAVEADDPGKILHKKVAEALSEFLRRHRPIWLKSLGQRARHNVTFQDEVHGEGASVCQTLFPGYWPQNQAHTFVQHTFKKVLGCSERVVRKALSQAITPDLIREHGVHEVAVFQQLDHSRTIHEQNYVRSWSKPSRTTCLDCIRIRSPYTP